jgi:hypothetical protein
VLAYIVASLYVDQHEENRQHLLYFTNPYVLLVRNEMKSSQ